MAHKAKAAFVPAYGLRNDGWLHARLVRPVRLVAQSVESVRQAAQLLNDSKVEHIILSTCYDSWEMEAELKKALLASLGVDLTRVSVIPAVVNTKTEVEAAGRIIHEFAIEKITIVADKWHLPRVHEVFRMWFPGVGIEGHSFTTPRFEVVYEPLLIKRIRGGNALLWVLWNWALLLKLKMRG
ncbi:YdcF family protein [Candidatus Kaiserbacteria bacterium]|nr:YdcF family protein [Candidatus Kaiserbacteria bacterium]